MFIAIYTTAKSSFQTVIFSEFKFKIQDLPSYKMFTEMFLYSLTIFLFPNFSDFQNFHNSDNEILILSLDVCSPAYDQQCW